MLNPGAFPGPQKHNAHRSGETFTQWGSKAKLNVELPSRFALRDRTCLELRRVFRKF